MEVFVKQLKKETNQETGTAAVETTMDRSINIAHAAIPPSGKKVRGAIPTANILSPGENLEKRKEMIAAQGFEPEEFAFERAIGHNDSLYSNFSELIALTKRKVGRIVIKEANKKMGYATGFMVSANLLLTNWHVFKNAAMAADSEVHFFYEYNTLGHPLTPVIFRLDAGLFFTSDEALDYCFVALQPMDVTGKVSLQSISYLYLDKTLGKIGEKNVEKLNIIHHPQGDYKQISIRENTFMDIDTSRIFYETDTAQGSSGSPVFNDQWQVVGLHHKSVAKMTADGLHYIDKDDDTKIIPEIDGKIDVARIRWLSNEGIRISVLLNDVAAKFPGNSMVAALAIPPPPETLTFTINNNLLAQGETFIGADTAKNISITIPVNALNNQGGINISLSGSKFANSGGIATNGVATNGAAFTAAQLSRTDELLLEIAKADREQAVDYTKCKGYAPNFLGITIPMPQPGEALKKQIARLQNNTLELKYFKYSVLFNAVTKMPALSAINVEGDATKRLDDSERDDIWLRDKRIDIECQLTDKFYAFSNFDKGHMSRFEDANWDDTEAAALQNAIYTCMYTNACPQVAALNRAGGLWGKLEKAILEKGIKKEAGKLARMTVFNGPIFDPEKDRIFKGVIIPMQFFKIIAWLDTDGKLRATAFKLTQELLVDEIQFDESMRVDAEALDIDKNVVFKSYQCSIKSLSRFTGIGFGFLQKFDTYSSGPGGEEMFLKDEAAIRVAK